MQAQRLEEYSQTAWAWAIQSKVTGLYYNGAARDSWGPASEAWLYDNADVARANLISEGSERVVRVRTVRTVTFDPQDTESKWTA